MIRRNSSTCVAVAVRFSNNRAAGYWLMFAFFEVGVWDGMHLSRQGKGS